MPTTILYNGTIYTMNAAQPQVRALAIRDGRVLAVGSEGKVQAAVGGQADGINLRGRVVVPGLTDAHVHLVSYALRRREVRLEGVDNFEVALRRIADAARALPKNAWVSGGGWDHLLWGGRWPTAADLDMHIPDRPVFLTRKDGHSAWVNSRALQLAGIDETTPDPPGGSIQREQQHATGLLFENAIDLVRRHVPTPSEETRLAAIRDAITEAHSYGMVAMHLPPSLAPGDASLTLSDMQRLRDRGELRLRCLVHLGIDSLDQALYLGLRSGFGDQWVRIGGVKLFADGSLGSETAEMLAQYENRHHLGVSTMTTEDLNHAVQRALCGGIAVTVHAIGDAANRRVLDAIEAAQQSVAAQNEASAAAPPPSAATTRSRSIIPNRIEHVQIVHPHDIPRFAQLGVVASMQPIHAISDMELAERLWGARCETAYAWKSLKAAGAVLAFGSDAPVEALNPWLGVHAAVTRQHTDGTPPDGWYPGQRLSVEEALWSFTVGPAIAEGTAHARGTLMPGKRADLAILARDPYTINPAELHDRQVDMTLIAGNVVWER